MANQHCDLLINILGTLIGCSIMFQTESQDNFSTKIDSLHTVIVMINLKIALHI